MGAKCSTTASECEIDWFEGADGAGAVVAYGNVTFGQFKANPYIAGIGTVLAFTIPTALALVLGIILTISLFLNRLGSVQHKLESHPLLRTIIPTPTELPPVPGRIFEHHALKVSISLERLVDPRKSYKRSVQRSGRCYDILEGMLMSIPDVQILLSLAVSLNFVLRSTCTLSFYHLRIALNLILIGCTNFVLAYTIVRNYWRAPYAAVLRILYFFLAMLFLGLVLGQQVSVGAQPEQGPAKSMNNSMILLNANCFLNQTLVQVVRDSTEGADGVIKPLQSITWGSMPESLLLLILSCLAIGSSFKSIAQLKMYKAEGPPRKHPDYHGYSKSSNLFKRIRWWALPVWAATVCLVSLVLYIWMTVYIFKLRDWVSQTGWIESDEFSSNPEDDILGLGQTYPIVVMLAILRAGLDQWHPKKKEGF